MHVENWQEEPDESSDIQSQLNEAFRQLPDALKQHGRDMAELAQNDSEDDPALVHIFRVISAMKKSPEFKQYGENILFFLDVFIHWYLGFASNASKEIYVKCVGMMQEHQENMEGPLYNGQGIEFHAYNALEHCTPDVWRDIVHEENTMEKRRKLYLFSMCTEVMRQCHRRLAAMDNDIARKLQLKQYETLDFASIESNSFTLPAAEAHRNAQEVLAFSGVHNDLADQVLSVSEEDRELVDQHRIAAANLVMEYLHHGPSVEYVTANTNKAAEIDRAFREAYRAVSTIEQGLSAEAYGRIHREDPEIAATTKSNFEQKLTALALDAHGALDDESKVTPEVLRKLPREGIDHRAQAASKLAVTMKNASNDNLWLPATAG